MEYVIVSNEFVDYGEDYISSALGNGDGENGWGIYFTQINDTTLYTINRNGDSINVYDLQSLSFYDLGTTIPVDVSFYGCIASAEIPTPRLYITGGKEWFRELDDLQILGLDNLEWLASPPSMTTARAGHGCIVVNDILWAIGGEDLDSVEIISITEITTKSWQIIDSVPCQLGRFGLTLVDEMIFIVGGYCWDTETYSDSVYTINTREMMISAYSESLPFAVNGMPVVMVDYTIYGFGGYIGSSVRIDSWMTLHMLRIHLFLYCIFEKVLKTTLFWLKSNDIRTTDNPTTSPTTSPTMLTNKFGANLFLYIFCCRIFPLFTLGQSQRITNDRSDATTHSTTDQSSDSRTHI